MVSLRSRFKLCMLAVLLLAVLPLGGCSEGVSQKFGDIELSEESVTRLAEENLPRVRTVRVAGGRVVVEYKPDQPADVEEFQTEQTFMMSNFLGLLFQNTGVKEATVSALIDTNTALVERVEPGIRVTITREQADHINWSEANPEVLKGGAEEFWVHEVLMSVEPTSVEGPDLDELLEIEPSEDAKEKPGDY